MATVCVQSSSSRRLKNGKIKVLLVSGSRLHHSCCVGATRRLHHSSLQWLHHSSLQWLHYSSLQWLHHSSL